MSPTRQTAEHVGLMPIETTNLERVVDTVILGAAAVAINSSGMDAMTHGYGADVVGMSASVAFCSIPFVRGDSKLYPLTIAATIRALAEYGQGSHMLAEVPLINGLDGVYDVRDYGAYALGTLLYVGAEKIKQIIRVRRQSVNVPEG
jgi:hypothetical protein